MFLHIPTLRHVLETLERRTEDVEEQHQRDMLERWLDADIVKMSAAAVAAEYQRQLGLRSENTFVDDRVGLYTLTSEDYESLDSYEEWTESNTAILNLVRDMIDEAEEAEKRAAMDAVARGVWEEA